MTTIDNILARIKTDVRTPYTRIFAAFSLHAGHWSGFGSACGLEQARWTIADRSMTSYGADGPGPFFLPKASEC
jgi:hypothetical protein